MELFGKILLSLIFSLILTPFHQTNGLSFHPDTIFIQAENKQACEDQSGNFSTREGSSYCVFSPGEEVANLADSVVIKIAQILEKSGNRDGIQYVTLIDVLMKYEQHFHEKSDNVKLFLARKLLSGLKRHYVSENQSIEQNSCKVSGFEIKDASIWTCHDGCNLCTCTDGEVNSTTRECEVDHKAECKASGGDRSFNNRTSAVARWKCRTIPEDEGKTCSGRDDCSGRTCTIENESSITGICTPLVGGCQFVLIRDGIVNEYCL